MSLLVIGLGSIGKRHAANARTLRPAAHVITVDPDRTTGADYADLDDLLGRPIDAAIIASPTALHARHVQQLHEARIPFYLEKPPVAVCDAPNALPVNNPRSVIGFQYRYFVGHDLRETWRQAGEVKFFARDNLIERYGPTCLETMASHSIDLALWLFGPAKRVLLETDGRSVHGEIQHVQGHSRYDLRIDTGPRMAEALWLDGHAVRSVPMDIDNGTYLQALDGWLSWVESGTYDGLAATLSNGREVMDVMRQCRAKL